MCRIYSINGDNKEGITTLSGQTLNITGVGSFDSDKQIVNSWNGFKTSTNGGAINNAGTLNISDSIFNNNQSSANGGMLANYGSAIISNSVIKENTTDKGGAIYNANTGLVTMINTSLINNNASSKGGAIYNEGTINIIADGADVTISGNTSGTTTKTSDAIYLENGSTLNLNANSANSVTISDKLS